MNTPTSDHFLSNISRNKVAKIGLLILIIVLIVANAVQGYFLWKQVKAYRGLEAIINSKSNCDKCPEQIQSTPEPTPTPTPTTTTTKSRGSGSDSAPEDTVPEDTVATPETVIEPPRPPSD